MPQLLDGILQAIEAAHFGSVQMDAEEHFVSMNAEYLSMLGNSEASLVGKHWSATVHPGDVAGAQEAYRLARTEGIGYAEIRCQRNDSKVTYQGLTVTRLLDKGGSLTGFNCLLQDISVSKRETAALLLAIESAPHGFLIVDTEGHIQSANLAAETLLGYTKAELYRLPVESLLPERFRTHCVPQRHLLHADESAKEGSTKDVTVLRRDGIEIPVQVQLKRVKSPSGERVLCTIIDIAERVRYQHQLELAKQAAEAANRAKSDFLSRMSHEIRTPMNLIMGMNALLLESPLSPKQRQHVEISHRNLRRLLRLINGILDLSKVEAGKLVLNSVPFVIHDVVEDCAATMQAAMERKGLEFSLEIDPDVHRYWIGDAERLQQVVLNLIGNAVKFTEKGSIGLRVRSESRSAAEKGLRFEVTDSGCGVPADKTKMIFEAFQQAEGSMNRPYEGTGLGLSIAKALVELMSGQIWVEANSDFGAKFVFTAYFAEASEEAILGNPPARAALQACHELAPGTRILMVEDNPENMFLLRSYLESLPVKVEFAVNGLEAVELRKRVAYDLILMDIQMPVMDGLTATREIRAWEMAQGEPRIPIVALTAHALSGAMGESKAAGCDGHLTKPVERPDLVETIATFAKRAEARAEALPDAIAARRPKFIANRQADLIKLREALAAGDFAIAQSIGHNCKGTGAGYGFPEIAKLGAALETAAVSHDRAELEQLLNQFARTLECALTNE
jgi:PAS domain S-box-containing protein